ncbi:MAG: metal ABC transporter ATP-binding protein [Clostridiales bacterium]|nr:metal ABC transporter ATP-binding protein [Clostridiales bacterium]
MDVIVCKNLTVRNERTLALDDVSFAVHKGEFLTIVGENGAGKSTLVKTILGMTAPDAGSVETDAGTAGRIGYMPQQSSAQRDFPASVREVVLSGCVGGTGFLPFYSRAQKAAARANMDMLGVTPFAKKNYRALSGGQQQRVLLCRALCAAGEVLLLDEPTTGLDPLVTKELYTTVKHLSVEHGMTVIMVSHDVDAAIRYSDRILHLATSLRFIGTPQDYLKTPYGAAFSGEGDMQNG